ncbi:MAG: NADH/ubiquinone/plastoquinone (complex I) [Planctomycetes bacterium]|nr:NADH/ubiquinone/plastoquinone (complex I) [Planctomycetota bacterium]
MNLIPLMVGIPLGAGFVLALMPKSKPRISDLLANAAAVSLVCLAMALLGRTAVYKLGGWPPPLGINLVLDGLSWLMLAIVSVISFAATLFSVYYMDRYTGRPRYYALFMLMLAGMNGAILSGDMFNLYVFVEIAAVSSYALVGFGCQEEELEAAFKYAVLGAVASAFILLGVAVLYCLYGTVNMAHLSQQMEGTDPGAIPRVFAFCLLLVGLGLKSALVPFHAWLPDAHPSAPAPISAMLSGVLIKAIGVYALIRVMFSVFGITPEAAQALMLLGTLSMVVGVALALAQWDFKRLLAYHSISQIGYVILGVGVGGYLLAKQHQETVAALAIVAGLFHLINHAVFKSLLFFTAGSVEYRTGTRQLKELGGLRERMPVTGGASLVASLSIAGVPPFNGFVSKLMIIYACVHAHRYGYAFWAVVVSILTLASFTKVQKYAFFGNLREKWQKVREVPFLMCAAMVLLSLLCLGMSLLAIPSARAAVLDPAQKALAGRKDYVQSVLGKETRAEKDTNRIQTAETEPWDED